EVSQAGFERGAIMEVLKRKSGEVRSIQDRAQRTRAGVSMIADFVNVIEVGFKKSKVILSSLHTPVLVSGSSSVILIKDATESGIFRLLMNLLYFDTQLQVGPQVHEGEGWRALPPHSSQILWCQPDLTCEDIDMFL